MIVIRLRCFRPTYLSQPSLVCDFCPSDQRFAYSFLQIPPHDGHPCCSAIHFPLSGHVWDFHPLERAHGRANLKKAIVDTTAFARYTSMDVSFNEHSTLVILLKIYFNYNLSACMNCKEILNCIYSLIYGIYLINIGVKFSCFCQFFCILQVIFLF